GLERGRLGDAADEVLADGAHSRVTPASPRAAGGEETDREEPERGAGMGPARRLHRGRPLAEASGRVKPATRTDIPRRTAGGRQLEEVAHGPPVDAGRLWRQASTLT